MEGISYSVPCPALRDALGRSDDRDCSPGAGAAAGPRPLPPGRGTADTVQGIGDSERMIRAPHLVYCSVAGTLAAAFGAALLFWPDFGRVLPGGPLPPLHTRCLASLHLALACGLWSARRQIDPPAARLPLLVATLWGGLALLNTLARGVPGSGRVWLLAAATAALGAGWLHLQSGDGAPPSERPMQGWTVVSAAGGIVALPLMLLPDWAATVWPWRMPVALAPAYGAPLLAFAVGAFAASRERPRPLPSVWALRSEW